MIAIGGSVHTTGVRFKVHGQKMDKRKKLVRNTRWLGEMLEEYLMDKRIPNQWKNGGVVKGRYGKGSKKWAMNAPSTVKAKGFNKPLFSSRGRRGSSLLRGYIYNWWHRSNSRSTSLAVARLSNEVEHAVYLHDGRSDMPARWVHGFIDGDAKKAGEIAVKELGSKVKLR